MIKDIRVGNITDEANKADIILGMNTTFKDVLGIAKPFVDMIRRTRAPSLGTVVSFKYDGRRQLHMLICHTIGKGGWSDADKFVRFGLDFLWNVDPDRNYSIVNIGTGRVGRRDGADHMMIRGAIAQSFLPVDLYVLNEKERLPVEATAEILPFRMWNMVQGEVPIDIRMAA